MKIIAVGRNYAKHVEELHNEMPEAPIVFCKPDSATLRNNAPFYYPDYTKEIHHEVEVVLKINKVGKCIQKQFAHRYYDEIGIGIDFTARDLQQQAKAKGLPWDLAKGFNGAAPISKFLPKRNFDLSQLNFSLQKDGAVVQKGNTADMLYTFDEIIAYVSRFMTLKKGDLIFTGTPEGVGAIHIGNRLEAFLENKKMMDFEVK